MAARGLWIDCLCIMHEAKPYGHLTLNGTAISDDILARMTGVPVDEVRALMAELRQAGVLSVSGKGVVYSRRMTKDFEKSQVGRKSVAKRWSQVTETTPENDAPNRVPTRPPSTETEEERLPPKPPRGGSRRASRGAQVFLIKAREIDDGNDGSEASVGGDRPNARRIPQLAIGDQRSDG